MTSSDLILDNPTADTLVPADLCCDKGLTVTALINCADTCAEALQVAAGQWRIRDSFDTIAAVDAGKTDGLDTRGYYGGAFDGVHSIAAHRALEAGRHHMAGVYDSATLSLYIDGACAAKRSASGCIQETNIPIAVGHVENGLGKLRGDIGRLRVAARAMSAAEIAEDRERCLHTV